ncbi:MAG: sensor histidine kinase [Streptosporangiaceae bacterium]|nr:sensor histidine kinase [Streptosporangiaceae bacterium]
MAVSCTPLPGKGCPGPAAVSWVSTMVYGVVLAAGLYYSAMGLGSGNGTRTAGFVAVMALLLALEVAQRWLGLRDRQWPVVTLLSARLGLFVAAAALDPSGESRALFVLVPFAAYFAFGRTVSLALAALCLVLLIATFMLRVPHWYTQATYLSDVLMFGVGLILAIAMANIAVGEQAGRARLEKTLRDLEESHVQLTEYSAQVAELSAEAERNRLARDIHDSLGHHLTAIAVQLEKAAAFLERDRATADQALADARSSARQALADVRMSVRALRGDQPATRLTVMLADLVRQAAAGQQRVTLTVSGDEGPVSTGARAVLYRSAQEALTNARRHSGAQEVTVSVTFGDQEARLVVTDDGHGFDLGKYDSGSGSRDGFGLSGMRERAALAGGHAQISSRPRGGTTVTVTVPRSAAAGSETAANAVVPAGASG